MKPMLLIFLVALVPLVSAGCGKNSASKEKVYDIKGKVVSVDLENKTVTLDHEDIPGFMKAMQMPFSVESSKILEGLKPGDQVQGRLKVSDGYVITELHKAKAPGKE